ncbi:MAG: DNA-binding protein [Candidatus Binatia bacterium]
MNKPQCFLSQRGGVTLSALAFAVLVFAAANISVAQTNLPVLTIADAKKLSLGTEVTIEGTVIVGSGTFRSSFSDYGFQIQDKTSGMYISVKTDLHLTVGMRVSLTGKLSETPLKFQIVETDENKVRILSGKSRPKPIGLATGKINELAIGKLIKISGTISGPLVDDAPYGFRLLVDDGTGEIVAYVSTSAGISPNAVSPGQRVEMTGVAGQFNHRFQIYPRSPSDLKLIDKK